MAYPVSCLCTYILPVSHYTTVYTIQCTLQYSTVQYIRVQYSTVQYSTVQYSIVQYSKVRYSIAYIPRVLPVSIHAPCVPIAPLVVHCQGRLLPAVHCSAVQCSAVQCSAVQCSAVQCSAVQCSAVQYSLV